MGWDPFKQISPGYNAVMEEDIQINIGGPIEPFTPSSHTKHWTDDSFTKPVAAFLATLLS